MTVILTAQTLSSIHTNMDKAEEIRPVACIALAQNVSCKKIKNSKNAMIKFNILNFFVKRFRNRHIHC